MNAAIRAVVRTGFYHGIEVCGIDRGYQGLVDGNVELMGPRSVSGVINRGGTILDTARCKPFYEAVSRTKAAEEVEKHGIEGLAVIGGDGTLRGALKLSEEHRIKCIGVPATHFLPSRCIPRVAGRDNVPQRLRQRFGNRSFSQRYMWRDPSVTDADILFHGQGDLSAQ